MQHLNYISLIMLYNYSKGKITFYYSYFIFQQKHLLLCVHISTFELKIQKINLYKPLVYEILPSEMSVV